MVVNAGSANLVNPDAFTIYDRASSKAINPQRAIQMSSPGRLAFSPTNSNRAAASEDMVSLSYGLKQVRFGSKLSQMGNYISDLL